MMIKNFFFLSFVFFLTLSCHKSKKKPILIDSQGRVLKTYDGHLYDVFDTLGRLVEFYGYANYSDWKCCVHNKIFYNKNGKESRRILYNFAKDDSLPCTIKDSADYTEYIYYYPKEGEQPKVEVYVPLKKNGIVKGYILDQIEKW